MQTVWRHRDYPGINFYGEYVSADKFDKIDLETGEVLKNGRTFRVEAVINKKHKKISFRSFQVAVLKGWVSGTIE